MLPFSRKIAWRPHATLHVACFGGLFAHQDHMHLASNPHCSGTTHRASLPYGHFCQILATTCGACIQTWPFWEPEFWGWALVHCQQGKHFCTHMAHLACTFMLKAHLVVPHTHGCQNAMNNCTSRCCTTDWKKRHTDKLFLHTPVAQKACHTQVTFYMFNRFNTQFCPHALQCKPSAWHPCCLPAFLAWA